MVLHQLRKPPQAPPVFTGTPTSIIEDTRRLIERSRKAQDYIVDGVTPDTATFANVLVPLAHTENTMAVEANILGFYKHVSPDSRLRDASSKAQKLLDDFAIETAIREDLYKLVDAVLEKKEDFDPESYHLLVKTHKNYIRNGLKLPVGSKRDRFKEIKRRLSQLTLEFRQNIVEENGGIWFLPQDLEGISKDVLSSLEKGEGEHSGMLRLTFKHPDFYTAMRYAKNGETRKRIYTANDNKCNQNVPLFKEVMVLRDEAARLLGYPNHAAFRLEDKMAKTAETVNTFLDDLRSRLTTGGARE
jgi:metallopeptidase MepB